MTEKYTLTLRETSKKIEGRSARVSERVNKWAGDDTYSLERLYMRMEVQGGDRTAHVVSLLLCCTPLDAVRCSRRTVKIPFTVVLNEDLIFKKHWKRSDEFTLS